MRRWVRCRHDQAMADEETASEGPIGPDVRPLRRSVQCKMLGGVAGGISQHFAVDVTLVRAAIAALMIAGIGVPLYLAAWFLIPEEGQDHSIADVVLDDLFGHHVQA
jgi:phage shock protein C